MEHCDKRTAIPTDMIAPVALMCFHQSEGMRRQPGERYRLRRVYDYELEFVTESRGAMVLDGETCPIRKGDVVFKRPGMMSQGILPYNSFLICFDMLGNTRKAAASYSFLAPQATQADYANPFLDTLPRLFHAPSYETYDELFWRLHREFASHEPHRGILLKACLLQILYQLYSDALENRRPAGAASPYFVKLQNVCRYVEGHIRDELSLRTLSTAAGLSPAYFQKIFKQAMGISPAEYVAQRRLETAKGLLVNSGMPITDVAWECGFRNIPYFSYAFKRSLHITPHEFRKRYRLFG